ncbi:MAG: hypothetical protein DRG78_17330 [Epsilonproteobacteria bacterium]|nr:MAG: hypothetical protein DRG78_17330 [Campylobacterota bacterium]
MTKKQLIKAIVRLFQDSAITDIKSIVTEAGVDGGGIFKNCIRYEVTESMINDKRKLKKIYTILKYDNYIYIPF